MMAYMITALVVAPMVALLIGGLLNDFYGWRAIFAFIALLGVAEVLLAYPRVPETRPESTDVHSARGMVLGFLYQLRVPAFLGYAGQVAFGMGLFLAFIGAGPYGIGRASVRDREGQDGEIPDVS